MAIAEGVSETVIAAVLLLHDQNVSERGRGFMTDNSPTGASSYRARQESDAANPKHKPYPLEG
jgi:hypothetical protein